MGAEVAGITNLLLTLEINVVSSIAKAGALPSFVVDGLDHLLEVLHDQDGLNIVDFDKLFIANPKVIDII